MKKALLMFVFLALAASLAFSASLTLVQPNGGETLTSGDPYQVKWAYAGANQKVKLVLTNGKGAPIGVIAGSLDAIDQTYLWTVGQYQGGTATPGSNYKIRVKAVSNPLEDISDNPFTIKAAVSAPDYSLNTNFIKIDKKKVINLNPNFFPISITSPEANGQYTAGQPLHIAWDKDIGVAGTIRMALLDDKGAELESIYPIPNTGVYESWSPDSKYTWPGTKYRIRLSIKNPSNAQNGIGQSGLFSITPSPPVQKVTRTLSRNGETETTQTREYEDEGTSECLSAFHPLPGRAPGARQIKVGHHVASGRHGECDWYEAFYFQGKVVFDLEAIKGKEIVEAKLLVSLSEFQEKVPQGALGTNEECDANCDVYVKGSNFPGGPLTSFSLFAVGEKKSLDVTQAVKHWAAGNPNNGLLFCAKLDHSKYSESVCLKYYGTMFLSVKYIEYK
ncbi:MAG: GPI anchored serine-threonine rich family protein [Candidatus Aminicenantes bacterium]|nr:GPI anchored serine-threonine rich family protein [Candidatus Aminicenantes bacterium]